MAWQVKVCPKSHREPLMYIARCNPFVRFHAIHFKSMGAVGSWEIAYKDT